MQATDSAVLVRASHVDLLLGARNLFRKGCVHESAFLVTLHAVRQVLGHRVSVRDEIQEVAEA